MAHFQEFVNKKFPNRSVEEKALAVKAINAYFYGTQTEAKRTLLARIKVAISIIFS